MTARLVLANIAALLLASAISQGAPASTVTAPSAKTVDPVERRELIEAIATRLADSYVFPDKVPEIVAGLRARDKIGAYATDDGKLLAARLTTDLHKIARDAHLGVEFAPEGAHPAEAGPVDLTALQEHARRTNFGIDRVEILEGNVGYVRITGFAPAELAGPIFAAAIRFVGNSDALIVDLRGNHGGSANMVQLAASYFLPGGTHLNDIYSREDGKTRQYWTLPAVEGGRYPAERPIFVLTDRKTVSAGEELAYDLQQLKRATLVGQTTVGAANPGEDMRVGKRFLLFVPTGRAINPVTGTNWDGTGVRPDVAIDAASALEHARTLAVAAIPKNHRR